MHAKAACSLLLVLAVGVSAIAADGNRLTYLDENNPYHVSQSFPKLITPQWVGEDGVDAVVILAIDDMRDPKRYEEFLRPILNRLKAIDGRAALSIMTCNVKPDDPQLQKWLEEGVSLECHTVDHPCPILQEGDFAKAKSTYDRCVEVLHAVPNSKPVAFRVPCCDSLNTPSPRFYEDIFNRTTEQGNFVQIDTSVFNLFTSDDPELPRELVVEPDGSDRFLKYIPKGLVRGNATFNTFVNTFRNYPYPYVIDNLCWEFPCVAPSDWSAQHLQKPNNPKTVADLQAAIDATVAKKGVFCLVFHPHGWIRNDQVVELIDHAVAKHGRKVKFLNFREALERINQHLLAGQPLRTPRGQDNGVRLLDVNNDGFLDVLAGNERKQVTRVWVPESNTWKETSLPSPVVRSVNRGGGSQPSGLRIGILDEDGSPSLLVRDDKTEGAWHFDRSGWVAQKQRLTGLEIDGKPIHTDRGVQLRDLDGDGRCELIVSREASPTSTSTQQAIFAWSDDSGSWQRLPFALPRGAALSGPATASNVRFVDLDEDGYDDVVFSDAQRYGVYLFKDMKSGWSREVLAGKRGENGAANEIPPIVRGDGTDNGFFVHSRHLFWQNEDTSELPDLVDRRSFNELLAGVESEAKSAEASVRSIETRPGFTVELVAAEPLTMDPVAFAWGPDGKFWVVEMADYPLGIDGKGKFGGRVRYLEDTDGDGRYDKSTLFMDGIGYPNGITPWRKGVLVTCAPDVFYAEDTDGDGKADVRETLFTGFVEGNQQHRVNGLVWGLDNWLYLANGDSGGVIKSVRSLLRFPLSQGGAHSEVNLRGHDLRIRPDSGELDAQAGQSQFGRNQDDWGNWFGCSNANPMYHFVLADQYLRRNPYVAAPDSRMQVSVNPGPSPVYPMSRTVARFNDLAMANRFTSANSTIVYRDELFGPAFSNSAFISEPVHNLVHREVIAPDGVTFTSQRAPDEQTSEFLASSDNWFRPTMLRTGPDGALWVADMYRAVIEHPEWIPDDWEKRLDLRAGHDKGRIYRVYPVGTRPRAIPRLDRLDTAGLVAALDSPNGWQRDMVQQMLVWRNDKSAVAPLEHLAADCPRPLARLHALCTLDGMGALRPEVVARALRDAHPGVRRHAIRLAEPFLASTPELGEALLKLVSDIDPQVRLQLAYSLGEWSDPRAGKALAELALAEPGNRYLTAAVLSSSVPHVDAITEGVLAKAKSSADVDLPLLGSLLDVAVASKNREAIDAVVARIGQPGSDGYAQWQFALLARVVDALSRRGASRALSAQQWLDRFSPVFVAARRTALDAQAPMPLRQDAIALLGREPGHRPEDLQQLAGLLVPQTPTMLQRAAVAALARTGDGQVPAVLVAGWTGYGPELRDTVLDALLSRNQWVGALLDAVEARRIPPAEIDAARRQRLLEDRSRDVRTRAADLLAQPADSDRAKVVDQYRGVLTMAGDAARGAAVFKKICAACHKLGDVGNDVGADLRALTDRSPQAMLTAILDPNRAVEAKFVNYIAVTTDGLTSTGMLAADAGSSITLVDQEGKEHTILRGDLESLESTGKSLMPEGIEKDLSPQDLADVIAFVAGNQPPPKAFPGNQPQLVTAASDGSLELLATNCAIYGETLVFEGGHRNLGYWGSTSDRAVWTVEVPRTGAYDVWLEWACDDTTQRNYYVLEAGAARLEGRVAGTGTWDNYRKEKVGRLTLSGGTQSLTFRAARNISGYLLDLKGIRLVPSR